MRVTALRPEHFGEALWMTSASGRQQESLSDDWLRKIQVAKPD